MSPDSLIVRAAIIASCVLGTALGADYVALAGQVTSDCYRNVEAVGNAKSSFIDGYTWSGIKKYACYLDSDTVTLELAPTGSGGDAYFGREWRTAIKVYVGKGWFKKYIGTYYSNRDAYRFTTDKSHSDAYKKVLRMKIN